MENVLAILPPITYVAFLLAERRFPARPFPAVRRARINIQRRIADALRKIEEACPPVGRRLSRAIRTGAYCLYDPD